MLIINVLIWRQKKKRKEKCVSVTENCTESVTLYSLLRSIHALLRQSQSENEEKAVFGSVCLHGSGDSVVCESSE